MTLHYVISRKWKWSRVQTKDFIQHIPISYNMKNKQKADFDGIFLPVTDLPGSVYLHFRYQHFNVSSRRVSGSVSSTYGPLVMLYVGMKNSEYSNNLIIFLKKDVFLSSSPENCCFPSWFPAELSMPHTVQPHYWKPSVKSQKIDCWPALRKAVRLPVNSRKKLFF